MCYIKKRFKFPKKATEDIYVLKEGNSCLNNFESAIKSFNYTPFIVYTENKFKKYTLSKNINEGFHSYLIISNNFVSLNCFENNFEKKVGLFRIPKGALYYSFDFNFYPENMHSWSYAIPFAIELVSNKIEYLGPLTDDNPFSTKYFIKKPKKKLNNPFINSLNTNCYHLEEIIVASKSLDNFSYEKHIEIRERLEKEHNRIKINKRIIRRDKLNPV